MENLAEVWGFVRKKQIFENFLISYTKFDKRRAFDKIVVPGKNPKLINVGPTFIPESRVVEVLKV